MSEPVVSISGVGKIRDGSLIRYASTGEGEGVVLDQSDPTGWFNEGNVSMLNLTVLPLDREDPVELSGDRVREVVAGPDEHSHGLETEQDGADAASVSPEDADDVRDFLSTHGRSEYVFTISGGEQSEVTGEVVDILGTILTVQTEDGESLGIPYATLEQVRIPDGD